jgi:hypothetical protein
VKTRIFDAFVREKMYDGETYHPTLAVEKSTSSGAYCQGFDPLLSIASRIRHWPRSAS